MSDVSRHGSFGGRPRDILNSLGLDQSADANDRFSRSWHTAFVCVPDESDEGGLIISCFLQFSYEKFVYEATQTRVFPTKIAILPLVPPRFSKSAAFCHMRATFEVKMSTPEKL